MMWNRWRTALLGALSCVAITGIYSLGVDVKTQGSMPPHKHEQNTSDAGDHLLPRLAPLGGPDVVRGQSPDSHAGGEEANPLRQDARAAFSRANQGRPNQGGLAQQSPISRGQVRVPHPGSVPSAPTQAPGRFSPRAATPIGTQTLQPRQTSRMPDSNQRRPAANRVVPASSVQPVRIPRGAQGEPTPAPGGPESYGSSVAVRGAERLPHRQGQPATGYAAQGTRLASAEQTQVPVGPSNASVGAGGSAGTGRPGEQRFEGLQAPQLQIEKVAPPEIQVGKECIFELYIKNVGNVDASDVIVHDEIPQGTRLLQTVPRAQDAGSQLLWQLGTVGPGEEKVVRMHLVPTEEGDLGSVATVHFASAASARARCTQPKLELVVSAPSKVLIQDEQPINIEIHNSGTGDATGVILTEQVPEGMTHPHGPSLEFEIGTLRAGETRKLPLVLQAAQAGSVRNIVQAHADAGIEIVAEAQFEVVAPQIMVEVDGPARRYLERPAKYTLALANPGTASATDVELVARLPAGMNFVEADNKGEFDPSTRSVYWSLAELPANDRGQVSLTAMPVEPGEQRIEVSTNASLGLTGQAAHATQVEGMAAIMVEVVDLQDPIEVGAETGYEIRVVNQGSKVARNVQVVAHLPPGMEVISAGGPTQFRPQQGAVVFAPLPELSPRADVKFRLDVQGMSPGDQRVRVEISTDDIQQPVTEEESTHVYAD